MGEIGVVFWSWSFSVTPAQRAGRTGNPGESCHAGPACAILSVFPVGKFVKGASWSTKRVCRQKMNNHEMCALVWRSRSSHWLQSFEICWHFYPGNCSLLHCSTADLSYAHRDAAATTQAPSRGEQCQAWPWARCRTFLQSRGIMFFSPLNSCWETAGMLASEMMLQERCMRCIDIDSRASLFCLLMFIASWFDFRCHMLRSFLCFAFVELWPQRGIIAIYIIRWLLALPSFGQSFRSATRRSGAQFWAINPLIQRGFRIVWVREPLYIILTCWNSGFDEKDNLPPIFEVFFSHVVKWQFGSEWS